MGPQVAQFRSCTINHISNPRALVAGEVIREDNIARSQFGNKYLVDMSLTSITIDGAIRNELRDEAA